jgi:hypothetical protein
MTGLAGSGPLIGQISATQKGLMRDGLLQVVEQPTTVTMTSGVYASCLDRNHSHYFIYLPLKSLSDACVRASSKVIFDRRSTTALKLITMAESHKSIDMVLENLNNIKADDLPKLLYD